MKTGYSSWLDRLVGASCSLLVAATAIYLAVHLIVSVLVQLIVITSLVVLLVVAVVVWRWWHRRQIGW
jgi:predicted permease